MDLLQPTTDNRQPSTEYRVLARKYRPTNFDELIGQDVLVKTLSSAIATGRIAHAFVLTGVRGIGKTTTARIIARALNCVGPDGTGSATISPCGVCENCIAIAADRHMDVIEMDAASRTGVDDIRELIDGVRYRPVSARYKVYIIDEVHMLSKNAFNALLKTLEEPPESVKFIFATTEINKVPVTVLSRCQRFDLRRLDAPMLSAHLTNIAAKENFTIEEKAAQLLAEAADGSVRDGLSLLDQAIAMSQGIITAENVRQMLGLADHTDLYRLLDHVLNGQTADAMALSARLYLSGADPLMLIQDLLRATHAVSKAKIIGGEDITLSDTERNIRNDIADKISIALLSRLWQMLLKGIAEVQTAPNPMTAFDMVLIRLCYAADLPSAAQIIESVSQNPPSLAASPSANAPSEPPRGGIAAPANYPPSNAVMSDRNLALAPSLDPVPTMQIRNFQELTQLFAEKREIILYHDLYNGVHLVSFAPGRLEIRLGQSIRTQNFTGAIGQKLGEWTGMRWVVSIASEGGEPTLAESEAAKQNALVQSMQKNPAVEAVLLAFPGAKIASVKPKSTTGAEAKDDNSTDIQDEETTPQ